MIIGLEQRAAREPTAETLSLYGAFHLVLAIAAARDNDRSLAYEHLHQAREIVDRIGEDRDDFGTEFGPTNVALHAVGVAVELGDAGQALDLARDIKPDRLSPERQAPIIGLIPPKVTANVTVTFANGVVHRRQIIGRLLVRNAKQEVLQFNQQVMVAAASGEPMPG